VSNECAVSLSNLSVRYGSNLALQEISLQVGKGTLAAVIGPNGGGKSTLFRSLVGLVPVAGGDVRVLGTSPAQARKQVSYLAQSKDLHWEFPISALQVVLQGRLGLVPWWRRLGKADVTLAHKALLRVGMSEIADRPIGELSGGQQQRVFLARALAQDAQLILLDEPATGLDVSAQHALFDLLNEIRLEGRTVLMTTHDLNCLTDLVDEVICINRRLVAVGQPQSALSAETLRALFGSHVTGVTGHAPRSMGGTPND